MGRAALAVCLFVVLAGCSTPFGVAGTPSPAASPTPTATATQSPPSTATPTPPPDPGDVGLAADGVVEPLTLRDAHAAALRDRSYTLVRTVTVRGPDGRVLVDERKRVATDRWRDRFVWNHTRRVAPDVPPWVRAVYGAAERERAYSNESVTVVETTDGGDRAVARYRDRGDNGSRFTGAYRDFTGRTVVVNTFIQVDTRVTDVDRTGGTVRYRLAAGDGPHDLRVGTDDAVDARVLSLSAVVERSGLVVAIDLRYVLTHDDERVVVRERLRIADVGATTVDRPAWVDAVDG